MSKKISATIELNKDGDKATINVKAEDRVPLSHQDILDAVVEMVSLHYELVTLPAERGQDHGLH